MIALLVAVLLAASPDPCAPVEPLQALDRAAAAAYVEVGNAERAAGARDTAVTAYRAAMAHDPGAAAARNALKVLCAEGPSPDDLFQQGVRLLEKDDFRGAATAFELSRRLRADPAAALLEGISRYELGEDAAARAPLRTAEAAPAHRDHARFYLGLVSLRSGSPAEAAALFDAAAENSRLGRVAGELARAARAESRLVLSLLAQAGWDSNVNFAPSGVDGLEPAADSLLGLWGSVLYRPLGRSGPYVRAGGLLQKQLELGAYDGAGFDAAAGLQLGRDERGLLGEYGFAYRTLGGDELLSAHRVLASAWIFAWRTLWSAAYQARFERSPGVWSDFSGTLQRGEVRAAVGVAAGLRIALAYGIGHDRTDEPTLTWLEHGPRAELRLALTRRLSVGLEAALSFRRYAAFDEVIGVTRRDTYLDGVAFTELDLGRGFTARASIEGRKAFSNAAELEYAKVVPMLGIGYVIGL